MREYRGIAASPGVAAAKAFIFREEELSVPTYALSAKDVPVEWSRFQEAVRQARIEVEGLRDKARREAGDEQAAIFEAHLLMAIIFATNLSERVAFS